MDSVADFFIKHSTPFTFYGDLLGVSNLYNVDSYLAKKKLNQFYNLIYDKFKEMAKDRKINIFLFSDSMFITGSMVKITIMKLADIYNELLDKNILFKGAMVSGALSYDKRIQLKRLQKRLPVDDVLFRAASLEKRIIGMRLFIEKKLAKRILPKAWWSEDLYEEHVGLRGYSKDDFRRRIVLTNDFNAYEYLWPHTWGLSTFTKKELENFEMKFLKHPYQKIKERLSQIPKEARIHLKETLELFKRAEYRQKITIEALNKKKNK